MTADYTLIEYRNRDTLALQLAEQVAGALSDRIAEQGRARLAVPGGTTPGPMLTRLGRTTLDWERVVITLTDERWVPVSSPRSNQRLLSETLFAGAAAAARFVPLYAATQDPADGLDSVIAGLGNDALPLDIAVLGMGADMHTASLFPGALGLDAALAPDAPPAVAITAPGAEEPRVTLSARVLAEAGARHILITGAEKRAALERAQSLSDPQEAPVLAVLSGATVHFAD